MPKVTEQYLVDRRRHILEAAHRCFLRNGGFQATSMQELRAQARQRARELPISS
ncbi:hypothetical protein ABT124_00570 [Streptomyces sp. NPDC001982]|uniref:hypothetical protein n=1 Tax=unclassified Streptomyces TaxID=2593676 RepID=UPI00332AC876